MQSTGRQHHPLSRKFLVRVATRPLSERREKFGLSVCLCWNRPITDPPDGAIPVTLAFPGIHNAHLIHSPSTITATVKATRPILPAP
jgi:hypothetical protein